MKISPSHPLLLLLAWPLLVAGQTLEGVLDSASTDLKQATAELNTVRGRIESERLPLARKVSELEQSLLARRAELAKLQRFQENQLVELNALKSEAKRVSDEVKYCDSLLSEYARAFRTRLSFVEEPRYAGIFAQADRAAASADLTAAARFNERSLLLNSSLERALGALGGETFEAQALDKNGLVQAGTVALIGPVAVFASSSGSAAGVLQQELNKADPTIAQLDPALQEASRKLASSGSGELILDPTLGNAFKLSALHKGLYEQLKDGGIVMIPLLGLGVAAVFLAVYKWWQFSRVRLATEADLQRVLDHVQAMQLSEAVNYARSIPGMAGDLLVTAVEHVDQKKEYIEEVLYEKMLGARTRIERGLPFLALAATVGPLMGLLGTVTGMIATFRIISGFGGGDPKMLAAGISEALVCTATGMAVAIPALLAHAFLSRRAKGIVGSMEQTAVGFVNGVPQSN
ncbi:MAG: MotA/TolQ/ExbB proton channel family protein [Verrucomicrobia bacterium]|jgi:biopolymer transport protein ExbB|nr:MotA/TolQ/ExbB proton channel family protein [Verrucomicrobiota bacterium]